jgi:uncharacterized membrane protein
MDQDILLKALEKHLDFLATIFNWAIALSIAVAWAGIQRRQEIEAWKLKFSRKHAFYAVCALFLVANLAVTILFLRIGDLLWLLDDKNFMKGFTVLTTHPWVLNPFEYFGDSFIARLHSCEGYGLLIVTWWLCYSALSTLVDGWSRKVGVLLLVFLLIGFTSMLAVQRVYNIVFIRTATLGQGYKTILTSTLIERVIATLLGIVVGILTFAASRRLLERFRAGTETQTQDRPTP